MCKKRRKKIEIVLAWFLRRHFMYSLWYRLVAAQKIGARSQFANALEDAEIEASTVCERHSRCEMSATSDSVVATNNFILFKKQREGGGEIHEAKTNRRNW